MRDWKYDHPYGVYFADDILMQIYVFDSEKYQFFHINYFVCATEQNDCKEFQVRAVEFVMAVKRNTAAIGID